MGQDVYGVFNEPDGSVAGFKYFQSEGAAKIRIMTRGSGKGKVEVRAALGGSVIGQIPVEPSEKRKELRESIKNGLQELEGNCPP